MIGIHPLDPLSERIKPLCAWTSRIRFGATPPCKVNNGIARLSAILNFKQHVIAISRHGESPNLLQVQRMARSNFQTQLTSEPFRGMRLNPRAKQVKFWRQ